MNDIKRHFVALALVTIGAAASATVDCADSTSTTGNAGYLDCVGVLGGNIMGATDEATFLNGVWGGEWTWQGKSDDAGSGPFAAGYGGLGSGTLAFDAPIYGLFVLAIKGGPTYSYYEFDAGTSGIASLSFDTLGVAKGNGRAGPGLSHFGLYTQNSPVPEPQSYALMLAGLATIGLLLTSRRRPTA